MATNTPFKIEYPVLVPIAYQPGWPIYIVVGKQLPNNEATTEPIPLVNSDGNVSYLSPAASALSRFCNEPTTLNTPIGIMIERY